MSGSGISWAICKSALDWIEQGLTSHQTHTHTNVLLLFSNMSGTTRVSSYQKGKTRQVKTNLDLLEQEWQWHLLGHDASLHLIPDNHANILPLSFLQAGCPSCRPTNSVKPLKEDRS